MKTGVFINYNSAEHGQGTGQVIDVIEEAGKEAVVICERFFKKGEINSREKSSMIIELQLDDIKDVKEGQPKNSLRYR